MSEEIKTSDAIKGLAVIIVGILFFWLVVRFFVCQAEPQWIETTDSTERLLVFRRHIFTSDEKILLEAHTNNDFPEDGKIWMLHDGTNWFPFFEDDFHDGRP